MDMDLDEEMARAMERLKEADDASNGNVQIHTSHRFPYGLRGITGEGQRYASPSVVGFGLWFNPYYQFRAGNTGFGHLTAMEDVKWAAAYWFCRLSGRSTSEVYQKVFSVVGDVCRYYGKDFPPYFAAAEPLATTMLLDGCFLMLYMMGGGTGTDPLLRKWMSPSSIRKDIFMLDNQIPYLVLEALMEFTGVDVDVVRGFIAKMGMFFLPRNRNNLLLLAREREREREREVIQPQPQARPVQQWGRGCNCIPVPAPKPPTRTRTTSESGGGRAQDYKPPHLLGLLLFHVTGSTPETTAAAASYHVGGGSAPAPSSLYRSAAELARIGVKLAPASSATARLGDMAFTRKPVLFAELSLSPLFLDDDTACWLVNMAALEEAVVARRDSIPAVGASPEGLKLSSYLSVLAMLVDGEEDVHQLRRASLLHGALSNTQALAFFKGLGHNLRLGHQYLAVLEEIDRYTRDRSVRIALYRFAYDNYKTIAAVLSIAGVLIGIFKALLSFKQH